MEPERTSNVQFIFSKIRHLWRDVQDPGRLERVAHAFFKPSFAGIVRRSNLCNPCEFYCFDILDNCMSNFTKDNFFLSCSLQVSNMNGLLKLTDISSILKL